MFHSFTINIEHQMKDEFYFDTNLMTKRTWELRENKYKERTWTSPLLSFSDSGTLICRSTSLELDRSVPLLAAVMQEELIEM